MSRDSPTITGEHRTQLLSDTLHAFVVLVVVVATTILAALRALPNDVIGTVYGGAIGYAAGRAGNVVRALPHSAVRTTDAPSGYGNGK